MAVVESSKLQYSEFIREVEKVPLQTYYQLQNNDTYSSSGYSFYIKSPGQGLLLDPEIWIYYSIRLTDTGGANATLANNYELAGGANDDIRGAYARTDIRYALRSGNIMQKATQGMTVIINGHSLTCEPWFYVEELNRLYISQDQSKHEFSASGGQFDNGNHSHRVLSDCHSSGQNTAVTDARMEVHIYKGFHSNVVAMPTQAAGAAQNMVNCISPLPESEYFFNQGYNDRYMKFADIIRRTQAPNANYGVRFSAANANQNYDIDIYERLPINPFKQYSNDHFNGMIPNVKDLTIRGQFSTNLASLVLRTSAAGNVTVNIVSASDNCQLLLKWYTPPQDMIMNIPKEISIPLRKINVWPKNETLPVPGAADRVSADSVINESNISLDGIPDLLLIYVRLRPDQFTTVVPDSYHLEFDNLQLNIEGASGKMNQIQTIELYNKWKKLLKHGDNKITPYDEWRRYMCIACLKPEDYGCIKGPGYDNPVSLGIQLTCRNWWNIPAMGGGAAGANAELYNLTGGQLCVVSIYDKWSLTIRDSGSAQSELTRVASAITPSVGSIGLSQLQPSQGIRGLL